MTNITKIDNYTTAAEFATELKNMHRKREELGLPPIQPPKFQEAEIVVEFRNFYLRYGDNPDILHNINLKIPKNKITAIIGPSGCGKSTLLRSINRMNEEISDVTMKGHLFVDGVEIHSDKQNILNLRTKIGMIFQKPQPFPRSIYDNVAFGPKLHGIKHKKQLDDIVVNALEDVGLFDELGERLNDHAYGLSGGQQQRLCIARTIAVQPSIILADEPASALDPKSTYQIEDLLLKLKSKYTVVIVTHNMQQAARISDYSIFMYNGNIVEYGKTSDIFENPQFKLTENYISGRFG